MTDQEKAIDWALNQTTSRPSEKAVLFAIAAKIGRNGGSSRVSINDLAKLSSASRDTVIRGIAQLEKDGLLTVRRMRYSPGRARRANIYTIPGLTFEPRINATPETDEQQKVATAEIEETSEKKEQAGCGSPAEKLKELKHTFEGKTRTNRLWLAWRRGWIITRDSFPPSSYSRKDGYPFCWKRDDYEGDAEEAYVLGSQNINTQFACETPEAGPARTKETELQRRHRCLSVALAFDPVKYLLALTLIQKNKTLTRVEKARLLDETTGILSLIDARMAVHAQAATPEDLAAVWSQVRKGYAGFDVQRLHLEALHIGFNPGQHSLTMVTSLEALMNYWTLSSRSWFGIYKGAHEFKAKHMTGREAALEELRLSVLLEMHESPLRKEKDGDRVLNVALKRLLEAREASRWGIDCYDSYGLINKWRRAETRQKIKTA